MKDSLKDPSEGGWEGMEGRREGLSQELDSLQESLKDSGELSEGFLDELS